MLGQTGVWCVGAWPGYRRMWSGDVLLTLDLQWLLFSSEVSVLCSVLCCVFVVNDIHDLSAAFNYNDWCLFFQVAYCGLSSRNLNTELEASVAAVPKIWNGRVTLLSYSGGASKLTTTG